MGEVLLQPPWPVDFIVQAHTMFKAHVADYYVAIHKAIGNKQVLEADVTQKLWRACVTLPGDAEAP
jgi:hypothetical protein